jgi:hypothetical protein
MTSFISHTAVDCGNAYELSEWWKPVLEYVDKHRIHFDLRPNAGTRDQEVERLVGLGATVVADRSDIHGPGIGWVTMADPEGNEFCVLRSEAEIQAATVG